MTTVVVAAAVIERSGRLLVARRPAGTHLAGYWEFPGGKCESGETLAACLARELREELDVSASVGRELLVTTHTYSDRRVELHFMACEIEGEPASQHHQEVRWLRRQDLKTLTFPPADEELLRLLCSDDS
ncbi:MAG TPA: (deoxy)nucleoside triphosphate pyrophosphohydrolase [Vicinamibacterales bacterium]|jgi:mutator protein MutT|nr:(deoxy)nucleoside triphosphate pyrophosphohydrolase [Vicinamibacterales bacterium]